MAIISFFLIHSSNALAIAYLKGLLTERLPFPIFGFFRSFLNIEYDPIPMQAKPIEEKITTITVKSKPTSNNLTSTT